MKDFVISVNNLVLYVSLAVIWLVAIVSLFTAGFLPALGIFVAGTLVWCIVSGFWFVQSAPPFWATSASKPGFPSQ